jgi:hypothetical protein
VNNLVRKLALALEVASIRNKQEGGALWGVGAPFQKVIDGLLVEAGRNPAVEVPEKEMSDE